MLVLPSPFCQTDQSPVSPVGNPSGRRDIKDDPRHQHHEHGNEKPEAYKNPPTECFFHGSVIVGVHCLVVWHVEQFAFDWPCSLSSGWSRLWHRMHCAEALSLLWSKLACCSVVFAEIAAGLNSTIAINNNLFMGSRYVLKARLLVHSPALAHAHSSTHPHIRVVLIPYPFSYSSQF